jgi:hypothetical protein
LLGLLQNSKLPWLVPWKTENDEGWTDEILWFKEAHQGVFVEKQ